MRVHSGIVVTAVTAAMVVAPTAAAQPDVSDYVRTESGRVRCLVMSSDIGHDGDPAVVCEASGDDRQGFLEAPIGEAGLHWHNAVIDAAGDFEWGDGNIGGAYLEDDVVLRYGRTYHLQGWSISPSSDGTRFTNDATGHGMFVSVENVDSF